MRARRILLTVSAAAFSVAVLLSIPSGSALADLEVTMPCGTPLDWMGELPERNPRYRAVVVKKDEPKPEPDAKGGTTLRGNEKITTEVEDHPEQGSGNFVPKLFLGVLTADLPFHVTWTKRSGPLEPRKYPPTNTDDIYWMGQAGFLRRLLHPALVPEGDIFQYLVLLGDSAREVSTPAKGERFLEPLATAVDSSIEKPPPNPPEVPEAKPGDTEEQKMLVKLAVDELMGGDPYALDPAYAGRILSLGEDGLQAILACAASPHSILRRNAIAVIGHYSQPDALATLRKAFREDKDLVVRTRALYHLIRRKDQEIAPDLTKALETKDEKEKRFLPFAAYGLGQLGKPDAVPVLVKAIEGSPDHWDLIVEATIALARTAGGSDEGKKAAIPVLKKLEQSLRAEKPRFIEERTGNPPQADIPDRPEAKNRMLLELATAALARLGDKEGIARFQQLIGGKYEDSKAPVGHSNATGPERAGQCESLKWVCPSSQVLVVETWAGLGPDGANHLRKVIDHGKTSEHLRTMALKLDPIAKDKKYLAEAALNNESAGSRSLAMRELYNVDEKTGLKVAENTLGLFNSGKPMTKVNPKGDASVVTALEILFRAKKLKTATLKTALQRAVSEFTYNKPEVSAEGVKPFSFSPPIVETICWMLGAIGDKDALALLKKIASDPKLPARYEAVVAIARIPGDATIAALVELLDDDDGWVRYNAFIGLKGLTGQDNFADWLFGSKSDREEATGKYRELVKKKK